MGAVGSYVRNWCEVKFFFGASVLLRQPCRCGHAYASETLKRYADGTDFRGHTSCAFDCGLRGFPAQDQFARNECSATYGSWQEDTVSVERFQAWRSTSRARQAGWPCERVTRRFVVEVARAEHGTALRGCRNSSPRARLPEGFCDHISERCQGRRDPLVAMPGKLGRNVKRRPSPAHGGALRLTKFACYSDSWQKCDAHGSRNALFNGLYA